MSDNAPDGSRSEPEAPRVGVDRLRADEELYQHAPDDPAEWAEYGMASDGLPTVRAPYNPPYAPPLTTETLCCIADTSKFVVRDQWGEIIAELPPELVERTADGRYRAKIESVYRDAAEKIVRQVEDLPLLPRIKRSLALWVSYSMRLLRTQSLRERPLGARHMEVEPVRPQCRHYARQATDFQDESDHMFMARVCTARRDDGGEFLSLRDTQMFACELRSPFDATSAQRLESFDAAKIELGKQRAARGDVFDVDQALADMVQTDEEAGASAGGIFKTPE